MRRGELLGLRWEHVDLDAGTVSVVSARVKVGSAMIHGPTKTTTGARSVDLDERTVAVLRSWKRQQAADRLRWGQAWTDTGLVFTREDGQGSTPITLQEGSRSSSPARA
jgi:integrase